jgi:hypothetical protein
MACLMSQRLILESRLETAVRLQSPVLRLPSELLSLIFIIGVLGDLEEESYESADDGNAIMLPTLMLVWQVAKTAELLHADVLLVQSILARCRDQYAGPVG